MKRIISILLIFLLCSCSNTRISLPEFSPSEKPKKDIHNVSNTQIVEEKPLVITETNTSPTDISGTDIILPMNFYPEILEEINNDFISWGPGVRTINNNRSEACVLLQEKYGDYNSFFILPEEENNIILTFDEGYENGYTPLILDTLKEKNVKAIFFITGNFLRTQPNLVKRMIDEGHIVGSHSNNHPVYCRDLDIYESFEDASYMQNKLREDYNYEMTLFRFPEGVFSEQSLQFIKDLGYKSIFWSFAYSDWDPTNQPNEEEAFEKIVSFLHPGEIMLLHATSETNTNILADLIDEIQNNGFSLNPYLLK